MPFLIMLVGIAVGGYFWLNRARNGANAVADIADMANDVRLAARRFGFKRQSNIHPAESIEDPNLAIAGIATAFLELDDYPTQDHRKVLNNQLRAYTRMSEGDADEMVIFGRWLVGQCGGPTPAIARLSRKLNRMEGDIAFEPLLKIVEKTIQTGGNSLNAAQSDALVDVRKAFKMH